MVVVNQLLVVVIGSDSLILSHTVERVVPVTSRACLVIRWRRDRK